MAWTQRLLDNSKYLRTPRLLVKTHICECNGKQFPSRGVKKKLPTEVDSFSGGGRGIRTHGPAHHRSNDFECCLSLADSRPEQVASGRFVKRRKPRRRKGLRTFRPVSARADLNQPRVQIKPRSCVKSLRSCAFARSQARKQRSRQCR